jgi:transcriptional regulator with XRE-family HTH domain
MKKPHTLRRFRKLHHLTQDQLFARSGISQARISRLEIGNVQPSPRERVALTHALKVPAEILFPEA